MYDKFFLKTTAHTDSINLLFFARFSADLSFQETNFNSLQKVKRGLIFKRNKFILFSMFQENPNELERSRTMDIKN